MILLNFQKKLESLYFSKLCYYSLMKTIIFDFDGTIANSMELLADSASHISQELGGKEITEDDIEGLRNSTIYEIFQFFQISILKIPLLAKKLKKRMGEKIDDLDPIEGIVPVLHQLKGAGFTMGMLTSNSLSNVKKFLAKHELDIFDFVQCDSAVLGKDRALKKIMRSKGFSPEETIYVGDEVRDIEGAQGAGIKVISVGWGLNGDEVLKKHNPDYFIIDPADLLKILVLHNS